MSNPFNNGTIVGNAARAPKLFEHANGGATVKLSVYARNTFKNKARRPSYFTRPKVPPTSRSSTTSGCHCGFPKSTTLTFPSLRGAVQRAPDGLPEVLCTN